MTTWSITVINYRKEMFSTRIKAYSSDEPVVCINTLFTFSVWKIPYLNLKQQKFILSTRGNNNRPRANKAGFTKEWWTLQSEYSDLQTQRCVYNQRSPRESPSHLENDRTCWGWIYGKDYVTPSVYLHCKLSWLVTIHRTM